MFLRPSHSAQELPAGFSRSSICLFQATPAIDKLSFRCHSSREFYRAAGWLIGGHPFTPEIKNRVRPAEFPRRPGRAGDACSVNVGPQGRQRGVFALRTGQDHPFPADGTRTLVGRTTSTAGAPKVSFHSRGRMLSKVIRLSSSDPDLRDRRRLRDGARECGARIPRARAHLDTTAQPRYPRLLPPIDFIPNVQPDSVAGHPGTVSADGGRLRRSATIARTDGRQPGGYHFLLSATRAGSPAPERASRQRAAKRRSPPASAHPSCRASRSMRSLRGSASAAQDRLLLVNTG